MEYVEFFGLAGLFIAAGAWLFREVFKLILNKDLERFKSDLEKESIGFKIRYEKLHGERMEVVKNVFQRLVDTNVAFESMLSPIQANGSDEAKLERRAHTIKTAVEFTEYFQKNRIFFNEELASKIDDFLKAINDLWADNEVIEMTRSSDPLGSLKAWRDTWKKHNTEVAEIKKELEQKFRGIIGID